ncbi:MAG: F0F1 ATP synthase subunit gamma, partial [Verrucomicrobia bacterium]|nr:F0F1 ATP synthase subunit gamma [Verrucomicrobiota bacterium]
MPNTRNIRHRIQSVRNTSQITRAMQTVAASKMRRAQDAAVQGRPFAQLAMQFLAQAAKAAEDYTHPLLEAREVRRRAVILVSTDKGLCGALNANLFRQAAELDAATTMFIAAGRKGAQFLARAGRNLVAEFPYHETPLFSDAQAIAQMARQIFSKKEADEVAVLYPRFVNTLVQKPETVSLLPMNRLWEKENLSNEPGREYLFEPTV